MIDQFDDYPRNRACLTDGKSGSEIEFRSENGLNGGQVVIQGETSGDSTYVGSRFDARLFRENDIGPIQCSDIDDKLEGHQFAHVDRRGAVLYRLRGSTLPVRGVN